METNDKEEILVAIAKLEEKNEHLEKYIYKDLKPHIQNLCDKIENCVEKSKECYQKNLECYHKNLRWMIATLVAFIAAGLSWAGVFIMRVI